MSIGNNMLNNTDIQKEITESVYGVKVYCAYNSEPPTSIIIDAIRSLNSDDHYLSMFCYGIKNIYHNLTNNPYTDFAKLGITLLGVLNSTDQVTEI